jgi:hypothetical protein
MGIHIEEQREFMTKIVVNSMPLAVPTEVSYKERIEEMAKRGKTIPSRQEIYNLSILFLTLGAFLIGVQVSVPSVRTRKSFPGCVKSFTGFPLDGVGDFTGLIYVACVAYKIRSSTDPWSVLKRSKEDKIIKKMQEFIETYYLTNPDVVRKFEEKANYLLTSPNELIPKEHALSKWVTFLPPLKPFHISSGIESVTTAYTELVIQDFRSGSRKQREKVLVIESKAILFSLALQEKIQKIVEKKKLILTNSSNEPFLENSCCDEDRVSSTTLEYFEKEDDEIRSYNEIIESLGKVLRDIYLINRAPYAVSQENTKNVYPRVDERYSEETIYRAFIRMCKFNSTIPLSEDLKAICSDKPSFTFGLEDSIHEMIRKLKQDGRNYDNTAFLHLLQIVNRKNLITYEATEDPADVTSESMDRLRKIMDESDKDKDVELKERITSIIDTFSADIKEDEEEESEDRRELRNFLGKNIKIMQTSILEFLTQYGNMNKETGKQMEKTLNHISTWERSSKNESISDNATYNSMQFMKTYMTNMTTVFPQIMLQSVDNENVECPRHWTISVNHDSDIRKIIRDYYDKLRVFYKDKQMMPILHSITSECGFLLKMAMNTPYYTDIEYKGSKTTSVFDERTSRLLFEYYMISILQKYIDLTENPNMISLTGSSLEEDSTGDFLMPSLNPNVLLGNKK